MMFSQVPNVLVLHLKRFSSGNFYRKITKSVAFSAELTIPYSAPSGAESSTASYALNGVVVHHGATTHSGHYIAYVKVFTTYSKERERAQFFEFVSQ
jgi:ubiquitin C-terminal hydrolase